MIGAFGNIAMGPDPDPLFATQQQLDVQVLLMELATAIHGTARSALRSPGRTA